VAGVLSYMRNDSAKDLKIIASLEKDILPYMAEKKISFYFDMDWCKGLKYESRSVVKLLNTNNNSTCLNNATEFSASDQVVFDELKNKLNSASTNQFREIDTEYPINYRSEQASLPHESIGIAFHIDCSFCRTRYVYKPNYKELPANIKGEMEYLPINENWYKIEQDWN
jgi:hypothetical protein